MARERLNPGTLSRARIVEVALDIAQREGPSVLSMRRIASELGTGAMSLYNHVPDKAALLEAMAEQILSEVEIPAQAEWADMAAAWATSLRATLLRHRQLGPVVITANEAQALLEVSQSLVDMLVTAHLTRDEARRVMRVVGRFVAGSVMLDSAALGAAKVDQAPLDEVFAFGLTSLLDGLARRLASRGLT